MWCLVAFGEFIGSALDPPFPFPFVKVVAVHLTIDFEAGALSVIAVLAPGSEMRPPPLLLVARRGGLVSIRRRRAVLGFRLIASFPLRSLPPFMFPAPPVVALFGP